jgi:hypothetical protein
VVRLERLSPLEQNFELGLNLQPVLFQSLEFRDLLLQRRAQASLLAGSLVLCRQLRQFTGVAPVDLANGLPCLRQCVLRFENPTLDGCEVFLDRRHEDRQHLVIAPQRFRVLRLLLCKACCENVLRLSSQPLESLSKRFQIPVGGVESCDLALTQLLLAGKLDEIFGGIAIGWPQCAEAGANVPQFFNLLRQVVDGSSCRPDTIRVRLQRPCALS